MATESATPDMTPPQSPLASLPQRPSTAADAAITIEALQRELAALRRAHQELQDEVAEEREIHEMTLRERDDYREIIYPPLVGLIPEEELIRFAETAHLEAVEPLHEFLVEIGVFDDERRK